MKILYGDTPIGMGDALFISIVSMIIVFFVLILISMILSGLKYIPAEEEPKVLEKKKGKGEVEQVVNSESLKRISAEDIKDERMLAAVSAALIDMAGETENSYIRLRSIREVN